jgi:hypothetical protein
MPVTRRENRIARGARKSHNVAPLIERDRDVRERLASDPEPVVEIHVFTT